MNVGSYDNITEIAESESPREVNTLLGDGWKLLYIGQIANREGHPDGSFQESSIVYTLGKPISENGVNESGEK